jgi:hypothetical protein
MKRLRMNQNPKIWVCAKIVGMIIVTTQSQENKMFDKTIVDVWFDEDSFHQFLISVNDEGTLFLTEKLPEVIK